MPLYEYACAACGQRFERIRKFSDPPLEVCDLCGKGPITRLMSSPAIQFKGSGWYITDYAQKGQKGKSEGGADKGKGGKAASADSASSGTTTAESSAAQAAASDSSASTPAKPAASKD